MADYIKPVIFRLGNQQFGVDINLVQSIEREINIVRVPNAMEYISGIVNLRGEVIPAFSLRKKFGTDDAVGSIGEDSTIIVNIPGVVKLALEVDDVLEIGDIDANGIVPMPYGDGNELTGISIPAFLLNFVSAICSTSIIITHFFRKFLNALCF